MLNKQEILERIKFDKYTFKSKVKQKHLDFIKKYCKNETLNLKNDNDYLQHFLSLALAEILTKEDFYKNININESTSQKSTLINYDFTLTKRELSFILDFVDENIKDINNKNKIVNLLLDFIINKMLNDVEYIREINFFKKYRKDSLIKNLEINEFLEDVLQIIEDEEN